MSYKIKPIALALSLTVPAAAVYLFAYEPKGTPTPETKESAFAPRQPASKEDTQIFSPEAGQRYTYSFSRKISFEGLADIPEITYGGNFHVDVLSLDAKEFNVVVSEEIKGLADKNPQEIRATISRSGADLKIYAKKPDNTVEAQHQDVLRDLLSYWVFPLQKDTIGGYRSRMARLKETEDWIELSKTKLAYIGQTNLLPKIEKSSQDILWDKKMAMPLKIQSLERTTIPNPQLKISSASEMQMEFVGKTNSNKRHTTDLAQSDLTIQRQADRNDGHPDYENLHWSRLSQEIAGIQKLNNSDKLKLFGDLVKLLRKDPSVLKDIKSLLDRDTLQQGANSEVYRLAVGTLATVASPDALSLMQTVYNDPNCSPSGRGMIQSALTTTQADINGDTINFLAKESQQNQNPDLQRGAAYALGSSLQNTTSSEGLQNGIQSIIDGWNAAKSSGNETQELTYIAAMGNSGRPEFYPVLMDVVQGNFPDTTKAKAIFALRFMNSVTATQTLLNEMTNPNVSFRTAAVDAILVTPWKEAYRQPLLNCKASENVPSIQANCVSILQRSPPDQVASR